MHGIENIMFATIVHVPREISVQLQPYNRIRNNMRSSAIFCAFQPYDQPNTCLPSHNGRLPRTHWLLLFFIDCLAMYLVSILFSLLTLMFDDLFPVVMVMINTSLTAEWPPSFAQWPVKSCYARTFILAFQIPYF